jgi:hypothetical protein
MDPGMRRQQLLDDVPHTLNRRMEAQGEGMPAKKMHRGLYRP